jgi:imidazolonepropionase
MILIHNAAQIVTASSRGKFLVLEDGAIAADDGKIIFVGPSSEALSAFHSAEKINAAGKIVLPGFVDPHTHSIFGGDRCHEFLMRLQGATYQEIAASGGGIQHTVRETRSASPETLFRTSMDHLSRMLQYGTTTVEIKSGYGLSLESEKKMLSVAAQLSSQSPLDVVSTFLGAHDFPPDRSRQEYIDDLKNHMLPSVSRENLAEFSDVFCDQGYYTPEETRDLSAAAREKGLKIKLHVDELADVNGAALAAELGAVSADHLIHANYDGIKNLADAGVIAVLLPGTSFALKMKRHAPARQMIQAGVRIALATDFNPGTCFSHSMQYVLQLAVLLYGLTPEEALTAATLNAAAAIDREHLVGSLEEGKQMDCLIFDIPHYGYLFYNLGVNHLAEVFKRGISIWNRNKN